MKKYSIDLGLEYTDPEFHTFFSNFAFEEVTSHGNLVDEKTRYMVILSTLLGCQGVEAYIEMLPVAIDAGLDPIVIKEILYQSVAFCGIGRILPFIHVTNDIMEDRGITLPLMPQGTTTPENRIQKGNEKQIELFGPNLKGFYEAGPKEKVHMNRWLSGNCWRLLYTKWIK